MALILCVAGMSSSAFAQAQPGQPGQPGGRGNRGNRGNFDPAAMREQMLTRIKDQLGASDDEWKGLQPAVEKVMNAQRDARSGGRGGFGGRRGGGQGGAGDSTAAGTPPANPQPQSEVAKAAAALQTAVDNKDTPAAELDQKLAALRDAKEKAKAQLASAQKELKELLTRRQEAILVNNGMLE